MTIFLKFFLYFLIYSILGWGMESFYVFLLDQKLVNRGFLLGPYCPIYGFGALINILYLNQYKDNPLTVFIISMVLCSVLEYITSYLMEKIFKTRWWDYSDNKYNLNGRVCLRNTLLFGLASLVLIYLINPIISNIINKINITYIYAISIIWLILFITDIIVSCNIISKLKKTASSIEIKDSTIEISTMVRAKLNESNKILQKRLLKAFPSIDLSKYVKIRKSKLKKLKKLFQK